MTTLGLSMASRRARTQPVPRVRWLLLGCGFLSSLLYATTDLLGGLRDEGYSFTSQAISELMAVGAPSESFVDPVIVFGALSAPFGVRLAAGQPTPGFGIIERIHVYAFMLWVAVFAIALLQRPDTAAQPLLQ